MHPGRVVFKGWHMGAMRYDLVFDGEAEPGHSQADIHQRLMGMFDFDKEGQARLAGGQAVVLGDSLDASTAEAFQQALSGAGIVARLVPACSEQVPRATQRRRFAKRRARVRAEAIQPDRRGGGERRE